MTPKENLATWMKFNGYGAVALGQELGVTSNYIYYLLSGERTISDSFRWKFSQLVGYETAQRVLGEGQHAAEPA